MLQKDHGFQMFHLAHAQSKDGFSVFILTYEPEIE